MELKLGRLHDLSRTLATHMARRFGVGGGKITEPCPTESAARRYAPHSYEAEKRVAAIQLATDLNPPYLVQPASRLDLEVVGLRQ